MDAGWQAAANGNVDGLLAWVQTHGTTALNISNDRGQTLVHLAAAAGHAPILEAIARWGGSQLDTVDHHGLTPLCVAVLAMSNQEEGILDPDLENKRYCIRVLRVLGANVDLGLWRVPPFWGWHLHDEIDDGIVMDIRHRVYFGSLLDRLLVAIRSRCLPVIRI